MSYPVLATPLRTIVLPCLLALASQSALANLMLHPTRIVLEKNSRSAQVELINNGAEAATYRISLVNRRMTEDGQFAPVDTPLAGELFADQMLRYSPRQITLQPGTAQTVRVVLRKPATLADGEYRSHLHFEKLPPAEGSTSIESKAQNATGVGVVLTALVGASMPVIVRHGATSAAVTLSHLALQKDAAGQPALAMQFNRTGNSSVYGDIDVSFAPDSGAARQLGKVGGVAVYNPNTVRRALLPLQLPAGVKLERGTLHATFRQRPEAGGAVLASAALPLP